MDAERAEHEDSPPGREAQALETLRWDWDTAYMIGHDEQRGWWAARRDKIGELIAADDPDALRREIAENYAVKPVPRETRTHRGPDGGARVLGAEPGELLTRNAEP